MLDRYEAQKSRIDRITAELFPGCRVSYGSAVKPDAIDGIHVTDKSGTARICLLQQTMDVSMLEGLPDDELICAFRKSAEVHGY